MKKKTTKKTQPASTRAAVVHLGVPTVRDRINRISDSVLLIGGPFNASDDIFDNVEVEAFLASAIKRSLQQAFNDAYWVLQVADGLLDTPAPDDDQRRDMQAGGAR